MRHCHYSHSFLARVIGRPVARAWLDLHHPDMGASDEPACLSAIFHRPAPPTVHRPHPRVATSRPVNNTPSSPTAHSSDKQLATCCARVRVTVVPVFIAPAAVLFVYIPTMPRRLMRLAGKVPLARYNGDCCRRSSESRKGRPVTVGNGHLRCFAAVPMSWAAHVFTRAVGSLLNSAPHEGSMGKRPSDACRWEWDDCMYCTEGKVPVHLGALRPAPAPLLAVFVWPCSSPKAKRRTDGGGWLRRGCLCAFRAARRAGGGAWGVHVACVSVGAPSGPKRILAGSTQNRNQKPMWETWKSSILG